MNKPSKIRASLIELYTRVIDLNTRDENIYNNGEDNLYPNKIERVLANSPTGRRAVNTYKTFCAGAGLEDVNGNLLDVRALEPINNQGQNKWDVVQDCAGFLAEQGGVFLWVGYGLKDGKLKPTQWEVLDYKMCRITKPDDNEYPGRIIYQNWEKKFDKKNNPRKWFYPFDSRTEIVTAQIERDSKDKDISFEDAIKFYRGQVLFINMSNYLYYPLSKFDAVYNSLDTEFRIELYINSEFREGFLGKTMILTQGLDDEQAKTIKTQIAGWLGAENASNVWHLDLAESVEDLSKVVHIQQVKSNFNEDMYEKTLANIKSNIIGAANSLPKELMSEGGSGLFDSGEKIKQLKIFYNEQTKPERMKLESELNKVGMDIRIQDIITESNDIDNENVSNVTDSGDFSPTEENLKAQAALRGSVGGVQGILGIQQSVAQGLTDRASAISILVEIYGFTTEIAESLLGTTVEGDGEIVNKKK